MRKIPTFSIIEHRSVQSTVPLANFFSLQVSQAVQIATDESLPNVLFRKMVLARGLRHLVKDRLENNMFMALKFDRVNLHQAVTDSLLGCL